jgi:hypothetical protein
MMGRGWYAKLDQYKLAQADRIARARHQYARLVGRQDHLPKEADKLAEDLLGARCERAGWVFFPWLEWHSEIVRDVSELPDLGNFIDVKGVRLDRHQLLVPVTSIKPHWAYLLVSAQNHPYYWIAGWKWGDELIAKAQVMFARPAYAWPSDKLNPLRTLQEIARG